MNGKQELYGEKKRKWGQIIFNMILPGNFSEPKKRHKSLW